METNRARNAKAGALFLSGIAAFAIQIPPASAADYGLGVSHGDSSTVLFPIKLDSLTIEPEISYRRLKVRNNATFGTTIISSDETITSYGLATGIYTRRTLGPTFEGYFGGRLGIGRSTDHGNQEVTGTASSIQQKTRSWFLGPTAGLEYYFSKQFSIALDVGLIYEYSKNDFSSDSSDQTFRVRTVDTRTRMLLRGYF